MNAQTDEASANWPGWLRALYNAADGMDASGFAAGFAADAAMTFGNSPATTGRDAIEESLTGFFTSITSMHHQLVRVWEAGGDTAMETVVSYGRHDGEVVDVPAVTTFRRNDAGEVVTCQIYCDMGPVYAT